MRIRLASDVSPEEWPMDPKSEKRKGPGWKAGPGSVVLENEGLRHQVVHVVVCKDDGSPIYDQFVHWEAGGAVTLPVNQKGEIGLVEVDRPILRSPMDYQLVGRDAAFDRRWAENLGRKSWEAPRGMARKNEKPGQTAVREGEEEIGSAVRRVIYLGPQADNTTFKPMAVHGYLAEVDATKASSLPPDVNEKIFQVQWHPWQEVMRMLTKGADCPILCDFTKSALAYWFARKFSV